MSRKSIKILLLFYAIVILVFVIVFLSISGHSILKVEKRKYNMNMSESINLDSVYSSLDKDVIWESSDDNVVVEDHVVTAISEGDAYVVGRVGNKQVSDVTIHVLDKDSSLAIKDHSIETTMDESPKIEVIVNNSRGDDTPSSSQVKEDDSYYHEDDTIFYDDVVEEDESITIEDRIDMCLKHLSYLKEIKNDKLACLEIRNHIGWYFKGIKSSNELKNKIYHTTDIHDIISLLLTFKEEKPWLEKK